MARKETQLRLWKRDTVRTGRELKFCLTWEGKTRGRDLSSRGKNRPEKKEKAFVLDGRAAYSLRGVFWLWELRLNKGERGFRGFRGGRGKTKVKKETQPRKEGEEGVKKNQLKDFFFPPGKKKGGSLSPKDH